ncbi:MAG: signal peptide peptidase SppA [Alphaproteobacteria bacterium]|nr:signal peptide peptidase SppA [Alphaproteobacteria bacterium]
MIAFLKWLGHILTGTLNGLVMLALGIAIVAGAVFIAGLVEGDGLPANMVLTISLDGNLPDSRPQTPWFAPTQLTVMNTILALDRAGRDSRVKGLFLKLGSAGLTVPEAEELTGAIARFRRAGKFVIADAQGFLSTGLGDYLLATSANQIWMQPQSPFEPAGTASGAIFLRALFDKIHAVPQMVKRAQFKSAADEFMEKDYTAADRLQTTALLQSWYDSATDAAAHARGITPAKLIAVMNASPTFAEDVKKAGLIDRIGYDSDALKAALARAGKKAKAVKLTRYAVATAPGSSFGSGSRIALIEGAGDIVDGSARPSLFGTSSVIAGDTFSKAILAAADDKSVKAILLRIDSPGGSVLASDQILHAVRVAQAKGKPVVVSMGSVAASGGYYISSSANRIVAEPGTITGSIGVLTGKVSFGKSLALVGVGADEIGVGANALVDSSLTPYTKAQLVALNKQADAIYLTFKEKVAEGRKMPLAKVDAIAKGRVWSGAAAKAHGLVDALGGFWTAVAEARKLAAIPPGSRVVFARFPRSHGFFDQLDSVLGDSETGVKAMQGLVDLAETPLMRAAVSALRIAPAGRVEMRATNLPIMQ